MSVPRRVATGSTMGLLAAALVCGLWYADSGNVSPGDLSAAHARLRNLSGPDGCTACHGAAPGEMASACLSCHRELQVQFANRTGFHGILDATLARDCGRCHAEHHGPEFATVNSRSFALAGVADVAAYAHEGLGLRLEGSHRRLACRNCHPLADAKVLEESQHRFLGLDQTCTSCHKDVHAGRYGTDCATCHGQERPFPAVAGFEHPAVFPLTGPHARVACQKCHSPETVNSIVRDKGLATTPGLPIRVRACRDCHASPHEPSFLLSVARLTGTESGRCELCHLDVDPTFAGTHATLDRRLHAATGFPLDAPHQSAECRKCHPAFGTKKTDLLQFRETYPGRRADDCRICHGDPHPGQFVGGPFATADCRTCHGNDCFRPHRFTAEMHAHAGFPLEGTHRRASCEKCHPRSVVATTFEDRPLKTMSFQGTPTQCRGCHADPHRGQFASGAFRGRDCSACHGQNAFRPARFTPEDHRAAGFPLNGAHGTAACGSCHRTRPVGVGAGGSAETVRIFAGTPTRCGACHLDPHKGQFASQSFRGRDCSACHHENSFVPAGFTIEQHAAAGYPLTGAHMAVGCRQCHPTRPAGDADGGPAGTIRVFAGAPDRCSACHADEHRGMFDRPGLPTVVEGRTDCARCHTTESFQRLVEPEFDHGRWTGYALHGAHGKAKCAQCHPRNEADRAAGRALGAALGKDCRDCHRDPHAGQFGPPREVDCARCHEDGGSFRRLRFDHRTDSRFPLDAVHSRLECAVCHRGYRLPNEEVVVRYKPLGIRCADCHAVPRTGTDRPRLPSPVRPGPGRSRP